MVRIHIFTYNQLIRHSFSTFLSMYFISVSQSHGVYIPIAVASLSHLVKVEMSMVLLLSLKINDTRQPISTVAHKGHECFYVSQIFITGYHRGGNLYTVEKTFPPRQKPVINENIGNKKPACPYGPPQISVWESQASRPQPSMTNADSRLAGVSCYVTVCPDVTLYPPPLPGAPTPGTTAWVAGGRGRGTTLIDGCHCQVTAVYHCDKSDCDKSHCSRGLALGGWGGGLLSPYLLPFH